MYAAVVAALAAEGVQVRRLDLGLLAVLKDEADDLVVLREILEDLGVGGVVAALGFLEASRGQAELVEENAGELHRAREIELLATRKLANAKLERLDLTNEFLGLRRQSCGVDVHARALHGRKHAHERHLDLGENVLRALSPERGGERLTQDAGEPGGSSRGAHGIRRRALLPRRGWQRGMQVRLGKIGIGKIRTHGIEQVRGNHRVKQPRRVNQQRVQELRLTRIDG